MGWNMLEYAVIGWKQQDMNGKSWYWLKIDGVGPVDNRGSTDQLHHWASKKEKNVTHDT